MIAFLIFIFILACLPSKYYSGREGILDFFCPVAFVIVTSLLGFCIDPAMIFYSATHSSIFCDTLNFNGGARGNLNLGNSGKVKTLKRLFYDNLVHISITGDY